MDKKELIALVKELLNEENLDNRSEDLQLLRRQYKYYVGRDEDSFYEQEETDKFIALFNELAKKEPKLLLSPYDEKKKIIDLARKLLDKKEILAANRELDKLNDDFVLGYYIHLYTDYLRFKYFLSEIYDESKHFVTKLDGTKVECHGQMLMQYIYNDYTNLNIGLINEYDLDLKIF